MTTSTSDPGIPPEVSPRAAAIARKLLSPIESFLHIEAASGIVLLFAAALAVAAANSPWAEAYHHLVEAPVGFRVGSLAVEYPLHFWINDGLMTIFFFVVGLEIRREAHDGELSNLRRAALPALAALGGMIAPALLFLTLAGADPTTRRGWGVPMATDIAFAVGVLTLLGRRVPHALRVLLLALAIIDDIGSIIVIALFYSAGIATSGLLLAAAGVGAIFAFQRLGVRRSAFYVLPGFVVWLGMLRSGIHPTIAGVVVGLMTPARRWFGAEELARTARGAATHLERGMRDGELGLQAVSHETAKLDVARREAVPPAVRLQTLLHPWVAFGIMPVFALANAGVTVTSLASVDWTLAGGITLGLVVGKPVGIVLVTVLAIRLGVALPRGIGRREMLVLGVVAGIGFTMALFVASLAFGPGAQLESAKLAILAASAIAIVLGLGFGRALLDLGEAPGEAASAAEAEASDDA